MKIGIPVKVLTHKEIHGIGYYVYHLLEALLALESPHEYQLMAPREPLHLPPNAKKNVVLSSPSFCFSYTGFPRAFRKQRCDLAFVPKEVVPFNIKKPVVITVYDLHYLRCPQAEKKKSVRDQLTHSLHYRMAKRHFQRADAILAISQHTKNELIELCGVPPEKITVTALAYDNTLFHPYAEAEIAAVKAKYGLHQPYFINTSSVWWAKKNILRLIEAFANLRQRNSIPHQLIIPGSRGDCYDAIVESIERKGLKEEIKLLEYVQKKDLALLIAGAEALVFPSLHEGFGLVILEAMACGCPVITSNVAAMPEVAADAALLVDPYNVDAIEQAMAMMIYHPELKKSLKQKGLERARCFSWKSTAQETLKVFDSFL
jgi:glycosyltransferase involved in cell wall biosynthesis